MNGRVLIIAGSDSGGGAGIQADIKTVTCLGGFAMTAITALTAQNTLGVSAIHDVPPDFVGEQIRVVLEDIGADCIKIGMLSQPAIIDAVCDSLEKFGAGIPVVVDPVMVAKGGASLLAQQALEVMMNRMIPMASVLTPNIPEAEALSGERATSDDAIMEIAEKLFLLGPEAVFMKGGHREGAVVRDILIRKSGEIDMFESPRIETVHTHGTGCTTASALACCLAQGMDLVSAVERARAYVYEAIRTAPGYGHGHGPLNHAHPLGKS